MVQPRDVFRRLRSRVRTGIAIEGAALAVLVFLVFGVVSFGVDRSFRLEVGYRVILLGVWLVVVGRLLQRRVMRPLGVELDDEEMALAVERADPSAKQAIISAIQFDNALRSGASTSESQVLMRAVVGDAARRSAELHTSGAVDGGRTAKFGALLIGGLAVIVSVAAAAPESFGLWARRNLGLSAVEWPRYTRLTFTGVTDGALRVPEGDDLTLTVYADGVVPEQVTVHYEFANGEKGAEPTTLTGERDFVLTLPVVLESATVHATGGDGFTAPLRIVVVDRPRIEGLQLGVEFPEYMGREPELLAPTGEVSVPRGGRLRVSAHSTKPLQRADLFLGEETRAGLSVASDRQSITGSFEPSDSGLLTLRVVDTDALDAAQPPRFEVKLVEDLEPTVEFQPTGVGSIITAEANIPGELTVRDDYGVRSVAAEIRITTTANADVGEAGEADGDWEGFGATGFDGFLPGADAVEATVAFDLRTFDQSAAAPTERRVIEPDQFVAVRFVATDNFGPGEPHCAVGDPIVFRVVTRDKLLEELTRRQADQKRDLEMILRKERTDLGELREMLSPAAEDPRAQVAHVRLLELARQQRALGRRARSVADNYQQILDELWNNRVFEASNVAELKAQIVTPLERLSAEDFPGAATSVQDFATSGHEDVRAVAVLSYESIIRRLEQVLGHMDEAANLASLLEELRETIRLQDSAIQSASRQRDAEANSLFGTPGDKQNERKPRKDK